MSERKNNIALLLLVLGAFNLGFAPIFVKFVGKTGMGLTAIAFWRMAIGGLILFIIALFQKHALFLSRSNLLWAALAGLFFTLDLTVWHRSIMYAGAGLSTILGNTQVFYTAILSYIIFKEKPSLRFFIAALTAMCGVIFLSGIGSEIEFTKTYIIGVSLGLLTGLLYALYLLTLRKTEKREKKPDKVIFIAWICFFCSVFMGIGSYFEQGTFMPPGLNSWAAIFGLALLVQVIGWWAIFYSMSRIETSRIGLVLLLQPTMATIWGYFLFSENLTPLQIAGGIITLISIYYGAKFRKPVQ